MTTAPKITRLDVVASTLRLVREAYNPPILKWLVLLAMSDGEKTREEIWQFVGRDAGSSLDTCVKGGLAYSRKPQSGRILHGLTRSGEIHAAEILKGIRNAKAHGRAPLNASPTTEKDHE